MQIEFSRQKATFFALVIYIIAPLASVMYIPSLPKLGQYLAAPDHIIELTMTAFILGMGISQLIYGPISDYYGRRKILLTGLILVLLSSIGCSVVKTGWQLIFTRFWLGFGSGAAIVLSRAFLRDVCNQATLTTILIRLGAIFSLLPLVAPIFGGYLYSLFGWRSIFITIAIFSLLIISFLYIFLPETHLELNHSRLGILQLGKYYWKIFKHPKFLSNAFCSGLSTAIFSIYDILSPFIFEKQFGYSVLEYSYSIAVIAGMAFIIRFGVSFLIDDLPIISMRFITSGAIVVTVLLLWLTQLYGGKYQSKLVIVILILLFIGAGLIKGLGSAAAISVDRNKVGFASGLYGAATLLITSLMTFILLIIKGDYLFVMSIAYILTATLLFIAAIWANRVES